MSRLLRRKANPHVPRNDARLFIDGFAWLGGGFGGIAAAVALRGQLDPADEIVLVERRPTFVMGLRKNWAELDPNALLEGERPLALLVDGAWGIRASVLVVLPGSRQDGWNSEPSPNRTVRLWDGRCRDRRPR